MNEVEPSSWVGLGATIFWPDLVVSICDRLGWDIFANDGIGANDCVRANRDIPYDHCAGVNSYMVFQRGIFCNFLKSLPPPADGHILINRDVPPNPHLTANNDTDRVGEVNALQIAEWNLAANSFLQEGPQDRQLFLQGSAASFRATVRS